MARRGALWPVGLAHLAPVLGDAPSGPTVRRALDMAGAPVTYRNHLAWLARSLAGQGLP